MKGLCLTGPQISLKVQVFPSTSDSPIQPWSTSHVSVTLSFKINQNIRILEAVNNVLYAKWQGP